MSETPEAGILSGLRVIDCGSYIAGPAAAIVMADFGAEVIKIERPPHGDPYRFLTRVPGMPVSDVNYCWLLDARNKKSVALNLGDAAGRDVLLKLVATADVFITNYQPQLVRKFRLSYEELASLNERLIYASITGYGEIGEDAEKPGYDMNAYWARSGLMDVMHNADAEPCQSPSGFGDHPTAMTLFGGIMLALYRRQLSGKGAKVETSLAANGVWSNSCQVQAAMCGAAFVPKWTRKTTVNPLVNHYVTRDGRRFIFCLLDPKKDWMALCRALGFEALMDDPRFATPETRRANGPELVQKIDQAVAEKDMAEWVAIFREHDVIWGPVPTLDQVVADPQMIANQTFAELEHPVLGKLKTVNNPVNIAGVKKAKPRVAPEVGEHSEEVLRELGYSGEAIQELADRGVIKTNRHS
ncbi:MAG TPA: CoA transferase [Bryobacteraceae bacterium]|nr:CoA transferase [Bryobacteraceae bacterium]